MVSSCSRGHETYYKNLSWYYSDNNELVDYDRPCKRCGKMPTPEGYDACCGFIDGATHVCCGHGVTDKYIKYD